MAVIPILLLTCITGYICVCVCAHLYLRVRLRVCFNTTNSFYFVGLLNFLFFLYLYMELVLKSLFQRRLGIHI